MTAASASRLHHRLGDGGERGIERQTLGEGLQKLRRASQLASTARRSDSERALEHLRQLLRLLMGARSGQRRRAGREGASSELLALPVQARAPSEDRERSDRSSRTSSGMKSALRTQVSSTASSSPARRGSPPGSSTKKEATAPVRAERELEQPLGHLRVGAGRATRGRGDQAPPPPEWAATNPLDASSAVRSGRIERVRERELVAWLTTATSVCERWQAQPRHPQRAGCA